MQAGGYRFDPGILHQKIELELSLDIFIRPTKGGMNLVFDNFIENQKAGIFKIVLCVAWD